MIDNIIRLLSMGSYEGVSEEIEVAEGKYKLETNFYSKWKQYKRKKAWQQK